MRTNIVLNEKLVEEALVYARVSTKRELVDMALQEFVENHRRKGMRELRDKIKISDNYDYQGLRK